MSRMLPAGAPARNHPLPFRDDSLAFCTLPSGTQVVAEIKTDNQGKLYLAAWPNYELHVATSCLLKPLEGDRVRATLDQKRLFITDILWRRQSGELELNSGEHTLHIIAPELILNGGKKIALKAESISLFSRTSRWVAECMNQMTKRWFLQADDAHRKIKFNENVEAENITYHAEEMLTVNGRMTAINGSAVVKVEGSQIHMG
ncbi:DUF3540 domain-containing protein [Winslowiella iniecta]|uniref:DUF3540 domain-containing protein n=1 Tax=Winslowiella iniecta TaxID=1560201 RepID=UPI000AEFD4F0|nr:DUF3540 domain-containing protein [Winslowiella iniecta]